MTEISCSAVYGIHTLEIFPDLVATNRHFSHYFFVNDLKRQKLMGLKESIYPANLALKKKALKT